MGSPEFLSNFRERIVDISQLGLEVLRRIEPDSRADRELAIRIDGAAQP
jgi:hypothetical protein